MSGRLTAVLGVGSAVVFTAGWVVAGLLSETADWSRGTINDLGAATADEPWLWNAPRAAAGVLLAGFGIGFARAVPAARAAGLLLAALGAAHVLGGTVFRRDCLSTAPGCDHQREYSWHHLGNEVVAPLGSVGLMLALLFAARAFRDDPRLRPLWRPTVVAIGIFVATLAAFALLRGDTGLGVVQRVSALAIDAWVALVAVRLGGDASGPPPAAAGPVARVRRRRRAAGSGRARPPS